MSKIIGADEFLARYVTWALWLLAIIVCAATVTGLIESYNGLYIWFAAHGITGFWADWAPLMVDSFTVVGELAIFAGISRNWPTSSRIVPWSAAIIGIGASIAGNVGDKVGHPVSWELTAAIPPIAAAFGIIIGLGILKRIAADHAAKKANAPDAIPEPIKPASPDQTTAALEYIKDRYAKEDGWGVATYPTMPRYVPTTQPSPALGDLVTESMNKTTASSVEPAQEFTEEERLLRDRRLIRPDGLDRAQTGEFPAIKE